jgi:hypothetical protein
LRHAWRLQLSTWHFQLVTLLLVATLAVTLAAQQSTGPAPLPPNTRSYETRYYRVMTDLDPALSADLCRRLDAMYVEYAKRLSDFDRGDEKQRFDVYLFARKLDYAKLTGNRFPNTAGVFMSGRNLLAAYLEGQGRTALRRTIQHEAFHQFAHSFVSPNLPVWVNEGLAQVFEESIWTGTQFAMGQVPPRRVRQLNDDLKNGRFIPFREMLALSDDQWADAFKDAGRVDLQYNQAWAMVHFLIYAADDNGQPRFRGRFLKWLKAINQGQDARAAFVAAFSDNIDGFELRFREWAARLTPTAEAAFAENQEVLADMLVLLNEKGLRFDDMEQFRKHLKASRARVTYTSGTIRWSSNADTDVYFQGPDGRPIDRSAMFFNPRPGDVLPEIICRPTPNVQYRTRFWRGPDGKIEHELVVEGG